MFYKYIVRGMIDNLNDYDWMPEMSKFLYEMNPNYVPQYSDNLTEAQQAEHKKNLENHGKVTSYLATQAIAPGDEFPEEGPGEAPPNWRRPVHDLPEYINPHDGAVPPGAARPKRDDGDSDDDDDDGRDPDVKQEPPRTGGDRFNLPGATGPGSTPPPSGDDDDDNTMDWQGPDDTVFIQGPSDGGNGPEEIGRAHV